MENIKHRILKNIIELLIRGKNFKKTQFTLKNVKKNSKKKIKKQQKKKQKNVKIKNAKQKSKFL